MTRPREERRASPQVVTQTNTTTHTASLDLECSCCDPKNPLVLRPDLGRLPDNSAEYALCVLHDPDPVVYRNRGDGIYVQAAGLRINARGEIVDGQGRITAQVQHDSVQRLTTVDDEEPPQGGGGSGGGSSSGGSSRSYTPQTTHVDLTQDDFYTERRV